MNERSPAELHWLVRPTTIRRLWIWSSAGLAVVAGLDFVLEPHPIFGLDGTPAFYAWYGFITCVAMVAFAKLLGVFLQRKDTYYDD